VLLERQVVDHELLGTDPDADRGRQQGQEAVVEASSASESTSRRTERYARHDDRFDAGVGELDRRTRRLAHSEGAGDQRITRCVRNSHEPVALDPRQQHPELWRGCVEEGGEVDLIGGCGVQEDRPCCPELGESEEVRDDLLRQGGDLCGLHVATFGEEFATTRALPIGTIAGRRSEAIRLRDRRPRGRLGGRVARPLTGHHAPSVRPTGRTAPDLPRRLTPAQYPHEAASQGPRQSLQPAAATPVPPGGGPTVVRTAVIPVAGLGTRFLPATKAVPKEMLPIVDRPAIQYIVEEVVRNGIDDVLLVTALGKASIEDHFDRRIDLEVALAEKGRDAELEEIRALSELATVHTVRQPEPLGLGHAVLMAAGHIATHESFAVLLGDDLLEPDSRFLARMVAAHERSGVAVVALLRVEDAEQLALYGVVDAVPGEREGEVLIRDLIEKPAPGTAPSDLAIIGRYVLPGSIFDVLRTTTPGRGGEIQLTDALRSLAADTPIVGIVIDEPRHDAGDKLGFLTATLAFAARRPDLGPDLIAWLHENLAELEQRAVTASTDSGAAA